MIAPRHYTVTSKPGEAILQCATRHVKSQSGTPDGAVSSFMHTKLNPGDKAKLSRPFGVFTAENVFGSETRQMSHSSRAASESPLLRRCPPPHASTQLGHSTWIVQ